eukprot:6263576-Ditylum_brightwellii.AAC.1
MVERVPLSQEVTTALSDVGKDDIEQRDKAKRSPGSVNSEGISSHAPTKMTRAEIRAKGSTAINKGKLEKKEGGQNASVEGHSDGQGSHTSAKRKRNRKKSLTPKKDIKKKSSPTSAKQTQPTRSTKSPN